MPDIELLEKAGKVGVASCHEVMGKTGLLPSAIKPLSPLMRVCGPAFTIDGPPLSNLALHHAIYGAQEGDVLVARVGEYYDAGYWGEILSTAAKARGLGGLIIDACVRDVDLLEKIGFPIFSRGLCPRGTEKLQGILNQPVTIGNTLIRPGDMAMGDRDGVVIIPRESFAETIEKAMLREKFELDVCQKLEAGGTTLDLLELPPLT